MNFVYILKCSDNTLYTGWTNNLIKRLKSHNSGKGAKYTRVRLPVEILYFEAYETSKEAMQREYHIKKHLSREEKLNLITQAKNGYQCENEFVITKNEKTPLNEFITKNIKAN